VATPPGLVAGEEPHVSAARHTPGPWRVIPPRIGAALTVYGLDGVFPVATTCSNTTPATMQAHREGTVAANAKLIAAAPELLDALQDAVRLIEHLGGNAKLQRAAIEKATP
jgi:hypothetical protein